MQSTAPPEWIQEMQAHVRSKRPGLGDERLWRDAVFCDMLAALRQRLGGLRLVGEREFWDLVGAWLRTDTQFRWKQRARAALLRCVCLVYRIRFRATLWRQYLAEAPDARPARVRPRPPAMASLPDDATAAETACVAGILRRDGRTALDKRYLSNLVWLVRSQRIQSAADLAGLDGPEIDDLIARAFPRAVDRTFVRSVVVNCRRSFDRDPPHPFETHLHALRRAFLERWPDLWRYRSTFGVELSRGGYDDAEIRHIVDIANVWAAGRGGIHGERQHRACHVVGDQLLRILRCRRHFDPAGRQTPWTALLSRGLSTEGLVEVAGRVCAAHHRCRRPRGSFAVTMTRSPPTALMITGSFNSMVRHGVFPNADAVREGPLLAAMRLWAERFPDYYAASMPAPPPLRPRTQIDDDVVQKLKAACRTHRERLVVLLFTELGLRVGGLANATVAQFWDDHAGTARPVARLLEKGCHVRTVVLPPAVMVAVGEYVRHEHRRQSLLLFPVRHDGAVPNETAIRHTVRVLCIRANIGHINCHSFRHWVINRMVERGHQ